RAAPRNEARKARSDRAFERRQGLVPALAAPLPEQRHGIAVTVRDADRRMPGTVEEADDRHPRQVAFAAVAGHRVLHEMLPQVALEDARVPQEIQFLGLDDPGRQHGSELRPQRVRESLARTRTDRSMIGHDRLLNASSRSKTILPARAERRLSGTPKPELWRREAGRGGADLQRKSEIGRA